MRRIAEIEAVTNHDMIAFTTNVGEYVGEAARYIHLGLTSSDVLDTALSALMKEAGTPLDKAEAAREVLLMAEEHPIAQKRRAHSAFTPSPSPSAENAALGGRNRTQHPQDEATVETVSVVRFPAPWGPTPFDPVAHVCARLGQAGRLPPGITKGPHAST